MRAERNSHVKSCLRSFRHKVMLQWILFLSYHVWFHLMLSDDILSKLACKTGQPGGKYHIWPLNKDGIGYNF